MNPPQKWEFGYYPRSKYGDLVFYVKGGTNEMDTPITGLFELKDCEETRSIMDALLTNPHSTQQQPDTLTELEMWAKGRYREFEKHNNDFQVTTGKCPPNTDLAIEITFRTVVEHIAALRQQQEREL